MALYYYEELTMKEVGAVLGIGESRVSQIHSLAWSACAPGSIVWKQRRSFSRQERWWPS